MRIKRVTWYSLVNFLPPFIFSLALFSFFVFWGVFLEKLSMLSKTSAGFVVVLRLALAQTPALVSMVIPVAAMAGAFFAFRRLMQSGEWKAFLAAGWPPFSMISPLLVFSLLIAVLHFFFSEFVAAPSYTHYRKVYNTQFKRNTSWNSKKIESPVFRNGEVFFTASSYDSGKKIFENFSAEKYEGEMPSYAIYASSAVYRPSGWKLFNVSRMIYKKGKPEKGGFFSEMLYSEIPLPEDLVFKSENLDAENFFSLDKRIDRLKKLGLKRKNELIYFWAKLSGPLSSLVMVLAAAAVALSPWLSGNLLGAGASLFFGFLFWNFSLTFQRMAEIETLSPFWGAFAAPVVFGILFLIALRRMKVF
ncbi:MAG: hypothetical protein Fur0012_03980 [Elusimicrobiota bacterium]